MKDQENRLNCSECDSEACSQEETVSASSQLTERLRDAGKEKVARKKREQGKKVRNLVRGLARRLRGGFRRKLANCESVWRCWIYVRGLVEEEVPRKMKQTRKRRRHLPREENAEVRAGVLEIDEAKRWRRRSREVENEARLVERKRGAIEGSHQHHLDEKVHDRNERTKKAGSGSGVEARS